MAKIKIGKKEVSEEKIRQFKDFKRLRANYDKAVKPLYKVPLYRDKRAFIALLIILLLTYIIAEITEKEQEEKQKTEQQQKE